jgi:hypothetical protein
VVRVLDQVGEGALVVLEVKVEVEDLVDGDRLDLGDLDDLRLSRELRIFHGGARDREHDDESHLALSARDLQVETLVLVAENLNVATF